MTARQSARAQTPPQVAQAPAPVVPAPAPPPKPKPDTATVTVIRGTAFTQQKFEKDSAKRDTLAKARNP